MLGEMIVEFRANAADFDVGADDSALSGRLESENALRQRRNDGRGGCTLKETTSGEVHCKRFLIVYTSKT